MTQQINDHLETGTGLKPLVSVKKLNTENQQALLHQKSDRLFYGDLPREFLSHLKTGNIQDLLQTVSAIHSQTSLFRQKRYGRMIPYRQFLLQLQRLAKSEGLIFDTALQKVCLDTLRRS